MRDLPIVCALTPAALEARRQNLLNALVQRAIDRSERPDGVHLRFAPDAGILAEIAAVIEAERQCCRFLQFTLIVEPDDGPMTLDLIGPAGTRDFLTSLFGQA